MAMMTFINLPVNDLPKAKEFFTTVGFSFDERSATTMPRAWSSATRLP